MATAPTWNEKTNQWEGVAVEAVSLVVALYADLPNPGDVETGTFAIVTSDPRDDLTGPHPALGGVLGGPARFWRGV